jgi:hypothetical protein
MHELVWLPPMPLLFQRRYGMENRPIPAHAIRTDAEWVQEPDGGCLLTWARLVVLPLDA